MRRWNLAIAAGVAGVALAAATYSLYSQYEEWGTLSTSGSPPRIEFCGRSYFAGDRPITAAEFGNLPTPHPWVKVLTTPSGEPVLAIVSSDAEKASHSTDVCTMLLAVEEGSDSYRIYPLSGGP